MLRKFAIAAAIFGGLGVILGAFGAHGLEKLTQDEKILHGFQTAVQYQIYHALALLALAILSDKLPGKWIRWCGNFWIAGIILFSGSLYLLTFLKIQNSDAIKFIELITPMGGVLLILGWLFLLLHLLRNPTK